jgi:hypothetical protein
MIETDQTYVVFCRIDGLDVLDIAQVATAARILNEGPVRPRRWLAIRKTPDTEFPSHSSVYGRFWLVHGRPAIALELGGSILKAAARQGLGLSVGIARGTAVRVHDVCGHNQIGVVVNEAARLASLPGCAGRIALEAFTGYDAGYKKGSESQDAVKKTPLCSVENRPLRLGRFILHPRYEHDE